MTLAWHVGTYYSKFRNERFYYLYLLIFNVNFVILEVKENYWEVVCSNNNIKSINLLYLMNLQKYFFLHLMFLQRFFSTTYPQCAYVNNYEACLIVIYIDNRWNVVSRNPGSLCRQLSTDWLRPFHPSPTSHTFPAYWSSRAENKRLYCVK